MNNMEIKQGDKVRVSSRVPRIYERFGSMIAPHYECKVVEIDDGMALLDSIPAKYIFLFPLKYLIKVDVEANEPKFKVGDKVRKKKWDKDTTISCVEWHGTWQTYVYRFAEQEYGFNCHKEEDITLVSRRAKEPKFKAGDCVKISFEWGELPVGEKLVIKGLETIDCRNAYMYSIEGYRGTVIESMLHPYIEPTAPTIKVGDRVRCKNTIRLANSTDNDFIGTVTDAENGWFMVHMNNGAIFQTYHESDLELVQPKEQTEAEKKPNVGSIKIPVEVDFSDSYWDAYTADLAKEIAVKVANKYSDPTEAAEYAVRVAKSVVDGLKGK